MATVFSPRPACGERSRASCERVRGSLDRLGPADSPPHPETLLRATAVIASEAKQSMARRRQIEDGLLRSARNDGGANCTHLLQTHLRDLAASAQVLRSHSSR